MTFTATMKTKLVIDMLMQRPINWLGRGQGQRVLRPENDNGLQGVAAY